MMRRRILLTALMPLCACGRDRDRSDAVATVDSGMRTSVISLDTTPPPSIAAAGTPSATASSATGTTTATPTTASTSDTVRGIIRRVGADPNSRLTLQPASGALWAIGGPMLGQLAATEGLEVTLEGRRTSERDLSAAPNGAPVFTATAYHVRAADGVEAHDGVLVIDGANAYLEAPGATRVRILSLPSALKSEAGARVFLVGPLNAAPQSFGVLRAKPTAPKP